MTNTGIHAKPNLFARFVMPSKKSGSSNSSGAHDKQSIVVNSAKQAKANEASRNIYKHMSKVSSFLSDLEEYNPTVPEAVTLLRGNHEDSDINCHYGFDEECTMKYDADMHTLLCTTYPLLPLCALVKNTVFVVHGGVCKVSVLHCPHTSPQLDTQPCNP